MTGDSLAAGDGRFFWPVDKPLHPWRVRIGVDFGGNGSKHAFVATAILPGYSGVVGLASQRIDPVAHRSALHEDNRLLAITTDRCRCQAQHVFRLCLFQDGVE